MNEIFTIRIHIGIQRFPIHTWINLNTHISMKATALHKNPIYVHVLRLDFSSFSNVFFYFSLVFDQNSMSEFKQKLFYEYKVASWMCVLLECMLFAMHVCLLLFCFIFIFLRFCVYFLSFFTPLGPTDDRYVHMHTDISFADNTNTNTFYSEWKITYSSFGFGRLSYN